MRTQLDAISPSPSAHYSQYVGFKSSPYHSATAFGTAAEGDENSYRQKHILVVRSGRRGVEGVREREDEVSDTFSPAHPLPATAVSPLRPLFPSSTRHYASADPPSSSKSFAPAVESTNYDRSVGESSMEENQPTDAYPSLAFSSEDLSRSSSGYRLYQNQCFVPRLASRSSPHEYVFDVVLEEDAQRKREPDRLEENMKSDRMRYMIMPEEEPEEEQCDDDHRDENNDEERSLIKNELISREMMRRMDRTAFRAENDLAFDPSGSFFVTDTRDGTEKSILRHSETHRLRAQYPPKVSKQTDRSIGEEKNSF